MVKTAEKDTGYRPGRSGSFALHSLRVAFIAGTLGQGGAERQLYYILGALREAVVDVRLFCLTRDEFWENRIRELGVEVHYVGRRSSRITRLADIVTSLRRFNPELIQSQHFYTNLYASSAGRLLGVQEIGAIRNDAVSEVRANGRLMGPLSLRAPRNIAANSRLGISNAEAMGVATSRLHFLPNVVDTDHFRPEERSTSDKLRLLVVGRLVEQKRMDRFIEVVSRLHSRPGLRVEATVVGVGQLRETLEEQSRTEGLTPEVLGFAGAVADMRPYYLNADVMVLTSEWEGTPNVLLEAMASGLTVVSTNVGGVSDIVQNSVTGLLVEDGPDDDTITALTDALERLASDVELRRALSVRARQFVLDHHSVKVLPSKLSGLYEKVLS